MTDIPNYQGDEQIQLMRQAILDLGDAPGGGLVLEGDGPYAEDNIDVDISGPAGSFQVLPTFITPPSWVDEDGNILEPGLYRHTVGVTWKLGSPPPPASGYVLLTGAFTIFRWVPWDLFTMTSSPEVREVEVQSLVDADLPGWRLQAGLITRVELDEDSIVTVSLGAIRMAH